MNSPWECPRCHKINAPHSMQCFCSPQTGYNNIPPTTDPPSQWTIVDRCIVCGAFHGKGIHCQYKGTS